MFVLTRSGKTACQITYVDVGCQVEFAIRTPLKYGMPANGVTISPSGEWDWLTDDIGSQDFKAWITEPPTGPSAGPSNPPAKPPPSSTMPPDTG